MAKMTTVYWRDIPAQVIVKDARSTAKRVLDQRFARAIDRAAMRAGRGRSDLYLSDWRRETRTVEGDAEAIAREEAARLERLFPPRVLDAVVRAGGVLSTKETEPADRQGPAHEQAERE
jgi:hypothetical protein